jgi:hypothetical protein
MAAKYIIFDGSVPFVIPEHIPLWDFYNSLVKSKLVGVATSCGKCYYDPVGGWKVFSTKACKSLGVLCKHK